MKQKELLPREIWENSAELYYMKHYRKTQLLYWVVSLSLMAVLTASPFVQVTLSSTCRGIMRGINDNNMVLCSASGHIAKSFLRENLAVKKGDTLLVIKKDKLEAQQYELQQKHLELLGLIDDANRLLQDTGTLHTPKYQREKSLYWGRHRQLQDECDHLKAEWALARKLQGEGLLAEVECVRQHQQYRAAGMRLAQVRLQYLKQWQDELLGYEQELVVVTTAMAKLEKEGVMYCLLAPVSGTLIESMGLFEGNFIHEGQVVAKISQDDSLIAELWLKPEDMGLVHVGQSLRCQFDAFHFHQWGTAAGTIIELSGDLGEVNGMYVYKVRASMQDDILSNSEGMRARLKKGMLFTGQLGLAPLSLWDLLYGRVDKTFNPRGLSNQEKQ